MSSARHDKARGIIAIAVLLAATAFIGWFRSTDLDKAIEAGNVEKVERMLAENPDPESRGVMGGTALHTAVLSRNKQIAGLLLARGYDVNSRNKNTGRTPLHEAVYMKDLDMVRFLVECGADLSVKDAEGRTALEFAETGGDRENVAAYLAGVGSGVISE